MAGPRASQPMSKNHARLHRRRWAAVSRAVFERDDVAAALTLVAGAFMRASAMPRRAWTYRGMSA